MGETQNDAIWSSSTLRTTLLLQQSSSNSIYRSNYASVMSTTTNFLPCFLFLFLYVQANPANPSHGSCTYPTPSSNRSSSPEITHLLPEKFFLHFQQRYLHAPSKDLDPAWKKVLRAVSLKKVMSTNLTTPGEGPLRLNDDVTLGKFVTTDDGRRRQTVDKISGSPIVPASVNSALDDGFSLTVHRVAHRIAIVNTITAGLAQAFGVRVTTDFTIHPGENDVTISAQDAIIIVVSGSCTAAIHERTLRLPFEEHVEEFDADEDLGKESVNLDLREGDLLYLPRGDVLSVSGVSMLTFRLHTEEVTQVNVMNSFIDVASVDEDSPLSDSLPQSEGEYSYGDLLKELVRVAAAVTEDLRRHFVVGEAMYDDDDNDPVSIVSDTTERFLGAAHALLQPGLEVLSEDDGIGEWAREADVSEVENGFDRCLEYLKSRDLTEECVAEVFVRWFERREVEETAEMRTRWEGLAKYGESSQWVQL